MHTHPTTRRCTREARATVKRRDCYLAGAFVVVVVVAAAVIIIVVVVDDWLGLGLGLVVVAEALELVHRDGAVAVLVEERDELVDLLRSASQHVPADLVAVECDKRGAELGPDTAAARAAKESAREARRARGREGWCRVGGAR